MRVRGLWWVSFCCLLASTAIAGPSPSTPELWAGDERLSWDELVERARDARIVYVGEQHGDAKHHMLQRDLLAAVSEAGPTVLGCEYFPRSLQPVLDRFNRGEISLEDFPQAVSWDQVWGHPWEAYAPLFRLCRERDIPVVALNAEREQVRRVRKQGLQSLELSELLALPPIDLDYAPHRDRVISLLQAVHPLPPETLERYYQAFTVWDSVMADSVLGVFLQDRRPGLRMVVVAGGAHVADGTGVPDRVSRRLGISRLTVLCDSDGKARPEQADVSVVFGARSAERWF